MRYACARCGSREGRSSELVRSIARWRSGRRCFLPPFAAEPPSPRSSGRPAVRRFDESEEGPSLLARFATSYDLLTQRSMLTFSWNLDILGSSATARKGSQHSDAESPGDLIRRPKSWIQMVRHERTACA